jgi:hypothetical protein
MILAENTKRTVHMHQIKNSKHKMDFQMSKKDI